jgi:hypothetical protein
MKPMETGTRLQIPAKLQSQQALLRSIINEAFQCRKLRAADCRHAQQLHLAGMPPSMIIEYLETMILYTAKARRPTA